MHVSLDDDASAELAQSVESYEECHRCGEWSWTKHTCDPVVVASLARARRARRTERLTRTERRALKAVAA